jgi:hypothetical protein
MWRSRPPWSIVSTLPPALPSEELLREKDLVSFRIILLEYVVNFSPLDATIELERDPWRGLTASLLGNIAHSAYRIIVSDESCTDVLCCVFEGMLVSYAFFESAPNI